tara:strand:+ start:20205 stop:20576 length:372 start_codon:yes stop_codon:yes gene_type:complete
MSKINLIPLVNSFFILMLTCSLLLAFSWEINAAEVLQVTNSSTLLIGDQNRNYTVKIYCLEVSPANESSVVDFLNSELPRHSKVNLQPRGAKDGILYAKLISLRDNIDITEKIISNKLAKKSC